MPPMPYQLEKGPIWSVCESALAQGPVVIYSFIEMLRSSSFEIANGIVAASPALGTYGAPYDRRKHLNEDWFGMQETSPGSATWVPQPAFNPISNPSTGDWINYYGD